MIAPYAVGGRSGTVTLPYGAGPSSSPSTGVLVCDERGQGLTPGTDPGQDGIRACASVVAETAKGNRTMIRTGALRAMDASATLAATAQ